MPLSRTRYERAFEAHLRRRQVPYVAVDQARRALLPPQAKLECLDREAGVTQRLKSFDFVIYGEGRHLLVEIKGRRLSSRRSVIPAGSRGAIAPATRLESWSTLDDVESLALWQELFGRPFTGVLAFVYQMDRTAEPAGFDEWFEHEGTRFGVMGIPIDAYRASMKTRSPRWRTVDLPARTVGLLGRPLTTGPRALAPSDRTPRSGGFDPVTAAEAVWAVVAGEPATG